MAINNPTPSSSPGTPNGGHTPAGASSTGASATSPSGAGYAAGNRNTSADPAGTHERAALRERIDETGAHLRAAAGAASGAVTGASRAVRDELGQAAGALRDELNEAASSGRGAAEEARQVASAQLDEVLEKGRDMLASAEDLIREKPLAAFGVAFASGYLLARLTRRH